MTTAKNVFIFLLGWIDFWWEGIKIWWGRVNEEIFCWWGDSPILLVGKTLYKPCQQIFIYNKEYFPCTPHTSCAKVAILLLQDLSTLCVADIYGIYFTCLFSVRNKIYHVLNMFNHIQWWKKYLSKEYLSLNITKHTC